MVTDAMVEAGCKAHFVWYDGEAVSLRQKELAQKQVRSILEAALSTDAEPVKTAPAMAVKALEGIDRLAEAGLCASSFSGARAFHEDIRLKVKSALSAQVQDVAGWKRLDDAFSNFVNGYGDPYEPKEAHEAETARNLKELCEAFSAFRAAAPAANHGEAE